MRLLPQLAALLLGAAAAYLVACGNNDNLIPSSDASRVQNALNEIQDDFRAGRCQAAEAAVAKAKGALLNLPSSVDSKLRDRLEAGVNNLSEQVPATCGQAQTQTQETQTQTQETQTDTTTTDTDTTTTETGTTGTGTDTGKTGTDTGTTTGNTSTGGTGTGGTTTGDGDTGGTPGEG